MTSCCAAGARVGRGKCNRLACQLDVVREPSREARTPSVQCWLKLIDFRTLGVALDSLVWAILDFTHQYADVRQSSGQTTSGQRRVGARHYTAALSHDLLLKTPTKSIIGLPEKAGNDQLEGAPKYAYRSRNKRRRVSHAAGKMLNLSRPFFSVKRTWMTPTRALKYYAPGTTNPCYPAASRKGRG